MMRTTLALGFALALVLASLLLVDPFGWLDSRSPAGSASPDLPQAEAPAEDEPPSLVAVSSEPAAAPDPQAERRVVDAEPTQSLAVFRLLGSEGSPVGRAEVVIAREEELLHYKFSDEQGEVSVPADGEAAVLAARVGAHPLELWHVRLTAGLHELRYPERARVVGRIELEDGAPAAGLRLRLDADAPMLPDLPVPQVVWDSMNLQPRYMTALLHDSSDDGGFSFAGLPADWSGILRLPRGWRIRSSSQGELQATPGRLRLEAPCEELLVRVAAPPTLRGRLLQSSDSTPLAGVSLSARLSAPESGLNEGVAGLRTDDGGRFELVSSGEPIVGLELYLGGFREGRLLLALESAQLPPDGDLGDVLVDEVRDIPFLLRRRSGEPIRGGQALAAGMRSDPTGEDGRGVLRWVPPSIPRLRAEARGFVPAEVDLGPVLPDPLVIVLEPACELVVKLVPPVDGTVDQFRVVLRREEGVTAGPCRDQAGQRSYVGLWTFPPFDLMQAPPASYLAAKPRPDDGRAEFHALRVGVPIELEVRGITGQAVYHQRTLEPFRAGEERRIEVALGEEVVVFRGRLLDLEGNPLAMATVQLGGQILCWTDDSGAFLGFPDPPSGTLVLQHSACATLFLHDYVVPPGGREVEFRLQPARQVTIEVVDEAGQPVPQAEVWILQEGFTTNTHRIEGARHRASSLTDNPFQIEARVGGRRYVQEHTSDLPEARVVVPVHGSVVARVSAATTDGRSGRMTLILQPEEEDDPADPLVAGERCGPGGLTLELSAVLPGRYRAWLSYEATDDERAAGREDASSIAVEVTVQAATRTEIRLDLD